MNHITHPHRVPNHEPSLPKRKLLALHVKFPGISRMKLQSNAFLVPSKYFIIPFYRAKLTHVFSLVFSRAFHFSWFKSVTWRG